MLKATIQWDNDPNAISYFIQYRIVGSNYWITPNENNPTINNFYVVENIPYGALYEFKIIAETCETSCETILEVAAPCLITSNLIANPSGMGSMKLTWDTKPWAVSYAVKYKKSADATFITAPGSPTTGTTLTITGLDDGVSYDFMVQVNCQSGTSTGVQTTQPTACPDVTGLVATNV